MLVTITIKMLQKEKGTNKLFLGVTENNLKSRWQRDAGLE